MRWFILLLLPMSVYAFEPKPETERHLERQTEILTELYKMRVGTEGLNEFRQELEALKADIVALPENYKSLTDFEVSAESELMEIAKDLDPLLLKLRSNQASDAERSIIRSLIAKAYFTAGATSSNVQRVADESLKLYTSLFGAGLISLGSSLWTHSDVQFTASAVLMFASIGVMTKNTWARDIKGKPILVPQWIRKSAQKRSTRMLMQRFWHFLIIQTGSPQWETSIEDMERIAWKALTPPACETVL